MLAIGTVRHRRSGWYRSARELMVVGGPGADSPGPTHGRAAGLPSDDVLDARHLGPRRGRLCGGTPGWMSQHLAAPALGRPSGRSSEPGWATERSSRATSPPMAQG